MSRFGYRNQREGQRGALLVLFALLLPVFFACYDGTEIHPVRGAIGSEIERY